MPEPRLPIVALRPCLRRAPHLVSQTSRQSRPPEEARGDAPEDPLRAHPAKPEDADGVAGIEAPHNERAGQENPGRREGRGSTTPAGATSPAGRGPPGKNTKPPHTT